MNATGHHWCDHCDEPSFGAVCQRCRRPARWIADRPLRDDVAAARAHQAAQSHQFTPVDAERGRQLFAEMIANLKQKLDQQ